jgi:hypothetical protein
LRNFWEVFGWRYPKDFLSRLVIMDETWLYYYHREKKPTINGAAASRLTRPKKFRVQKSTGKILD